MAEISYTLVGFKPQPLKQGLNCTGKVHQQCSVRGGCRALAGPGQIPGHSSYAELLQFIFAELLQSTFPEPCPPAERISPTETALFSSSYTNSIVTNIKAVAQLEKMHFPKGKEFL